MDFSDSSDPMAGMGGGPSPYMKDLVEKLNFIKSDILSLWNVPDVSQKWCVVLSSFNQTLVLNVTLG